MVPHLLWQLLQRSSRFAGSLVPPSLSARTWSTSPSIPSVLHLLPSHQAQTFPQSVHLPRVRAMASWRASLYAFVP